MWDTKFSEMDERSKAITVTMGPAECLKGLLWNDERCYLEALAEIFPKEQEEKYAFLVGYMVRHERELYIQIGNILAAVLARTPGVEMTQIENRRKHMAVALLKGRESFLNEYLDSIENCMINPRWKEETVWAVQTFSDIQEVCEVFWKTCSDLKYGLTFGGEHILRDLDEKSFVAEEVAYPISLERQIGIAVGNCDRQNCLEKTELFLQQVMQGIHWPDDIRYAACRLMQHMRDIVKESNVQAYYELKSQNMAERILNANCRSQLYDTLAKIGEIVCNEHDEKRLNNYNINRALEYIRIHYNEGITLEETARALNITPEYLSMLFKREVGINFSVFLKRFRISHAKRLLKGTDMKVREIAAACGYSNSNYFIKVFREVTGSVPTEFR